MTNDTSGYETLSCDVTTVEYGQLTIDKLDDPASTEDMLVDFTSNSSYDNTQVFLVRINVL